MATLHTGLPKHPGELALAQQLNGIADPRLHLWFNLSGIPGVRDIDLVIWHEAAGVFVVEIKAVPIAAIERFGYQVCRIRGRDSGESPQEQAYAGLNGLIRMFGRSSLPRMVATACWPLISRDRWNQHWDEQSVCGPFADKMLFVEDLPTPNTLTRRLQHIYREPPVRSGNTWSRHEPSDIAKFDRLLSPDARPRPAKSDLKRLETINERVRQKARHDAPSGATTRLRYFGRPGTGKTFRLLAIAFEHATAGKRVLFACFNKVLAADLLRLLDAWLGASAATGALRIQDVFELASEMNAALRLGVFESGYDGWGASVVEALRQRPDEFAAFDTLLVDEAQDMKGWHFELLCLLAKPDATMCVAEGTGQELYGERAGWLTDFACASRPCGLRRTFRNTRPANQFAQTFYEAALDPAHVPAVVQRFKTTSPAQYDLFERNEGGWPQLTLLIQPALDYDNAHRPEFADEKAELMAREYERLVRQELERLREDERPMDLLVLVPGPVDVERGWAAAALARIGEFTDYTDDKNRRVIASPDKIRLCTFKSARGLEGMRVLIFGVERMARLASHDDELKSLGYVILSRSLFETVVVVQGFDQKVAPFLEAAIHELRRHDKELTSSAEARAKNLPDDDLGPAPDLAALPLLSSPPAAKRPTLAAVPRQEMIKKPAKEPDLGERYNAFISNKAILQRERLKQAREEWLPQLLAASEEVRRAAAAATGREITSPKANQELLELTAALQKRQA